MKHHTRPALIGGFVVGGIALIITTLVIVAGSKFSKNTAPFVAYFTGSVDGLARGAPVKFRGIEVGYVRDIYLSLGKQLDPKDVRIPVVFELDADRFATRGLTVDLHDRDSFERIVGQGLRARLSSGSLITGERTIQLDIVPNSPVDRVADPTVEFPEVPTMSGTLDSAQASALAVLDKLSRLDLEHFGATIQHILDGVDRTVNDPAIGATLADVRGAAGDLKATLAELKTTLVEVRGAVGEAKTTLVATRTAITNGGALVAKTDKLLDHATAAVDKLGTVEPLAKELTAAAERVLGTVDAAVRAMQHLAQHLDQDPASVLRGGNP